MGRGVYVDAEGTIHRASRTDQAGGRERDGRTVFGHPVEYAGRPGSSSDIRAAQERAAARLRRLESRPRSPQPESRAIHEARRRARVIYETRRDAGW